MIHSFCFSFTYRTLDRTWSIFPHNKPICQNEWVEACSLRCGYSTHTICWRFMSSPFSLIIIAIIGTDEFRVAVIRVHFVTIVFCAAFCEVSWRKKTNDRWENYVKTEIARWENEPIYWKKDRYFAAVYVSLMSIMFFAWNFIQIWHYTKLNHIFRVFLTIFYTLEKYYSHRKCALNSKVKVDQYKLTQRLLKPIHVLHKRSNILFRSSKFKFYSALTSWITVNYTSIF